ncbi:MAG TPA: GNAT family N-acetyltransferase, partial [Rubrobacteraceae bacterium]|nr:GNAT family N-acetyltransferase [Rubrobacteraceae bacterium]
RLVRALPDIPRGVETRSMLLSGRCEIFGLEGRTEPCFVVRDSEEHKEQLVSVVGRPAEGAIREAVTHNRDASIVLAPPETRFHVLAALPDWKTTRATLHLLGDAPQLPHVSAGAVRLIAPSELSSIDELPPDLLSELRVAARRSPIVASLVGGRPVSFCYVAAQTEGLWDISIDTLAEHRRQGHAARCVTYMIEHMRRQGRMPVWGAEETNPPSLRLAAKLGFVPVDELIVFRPARN